MSDRLDYAAYSFVLKALGEKHDDRLDWWMHCAMNRVRVLSPDSFRHRSGAPNG